MRDYYSLRFVASTYKIFAWIILALGALVTVFSSPDWLRMPYSVVYLIAWALLIGFLFMGFMSVAQSIMLMINMASDVETMANNSYVLAEQAEKQRLQYEKQSIENQKNIIALLSSLQQGGNINPKTYINPDNI